jgi:hypothetical protein
VCFAKYIKERRQLKQNQTPDIQVVANAVDGSTVIFTKGTFGAAVFTESVREQKAEFVDAGNVKHGFLRRVAYWSNGERGGWNVKPCDEAKGAFIATYVEILE